MSATQALANLAVAANAAAAALSTSTIETEEKPGLRLPNGERVLDYARRLYIHSISTWIDDGALEGKDIVDLEVDVHRNDEPYYLVHWPGTKNCAIIYPSNGGAGNCPWRMQEMRYDTMIESFLRARGAWN